MFRLAYRAKKALVGSIIFPILLAGCGGGSFDSILEKQIVFRCPPVHVIEQAASYTAFKNAAIGDLDQALYTMRFVQLKGNCALSKNQEFRQDFHVSFLIKPENAMPKELAAKGEWFITVLRDQGVKNPPEVLLRKTFTQQVTLTRGGDVVPLKEYFTLTMPNITLDEIPSLAVMGGFVLNEQEWDFQEDNPFLF